MKALIIIAAHVVTFRMPANNDGRHFVCSSQVSTANRGDTDTNTRIIQLALLYVVVVVVVAHVVSSAFY